MPKARYAKRQRDLKESLERERERDVSRRDTCQKRSRENSGMRERLSDIEILRDKGGTRFTNTPRERGMDG